MRKTLTQLALNESVIEALTALAGEIAVRQMAGDFVAGSEFETVVRAAKFDGGRDTMARFIRELRALADTAKYDRGSPATST